MALLALDLFPHWWCALLPPLLLSPLLTLLAGLMLALLPPLLVGLRAPLGLLTALLVPLLVQRPLLVHGAGAYGRAAAACTAAPTGGRAAAAFGAKADCVSAVYVVSEARARRGRVFRMMALACIIAYGSA